MIYQPRRDFLKPGQQADQKVWMSNDAGLGYAGFSVANGALYTMGAFGNSEKLIAYRAVQFFLEQKVWELEVGELLTTAGVMVPGQHPRSDGKYMP